MIKLICVLALVALCSSLNYDRTFIFENKLNRTIWMGCEGIKKHDHLNNGGWIIKAGKTMSIDNVPSDWAGRFWARTYCNSKTKKCETGDCGKGVQCNGAKSETPVTYAEFTLDSHGDVDYYDISLVDGFNVKMEIENRGTPNPGKDKTYCGIAKCDYDFTQDCPEALKQIGENNKIVACKSGCRATGRDDYCCMHQHSRPAFVCDPTIGPTNYAKYFKDKCPDAYTYAQDHDTTFYCVAPVYKINIG